MGLEYEKQNLNNEKILGFNLGNVLKDKKNQDLPSKTKLDQTRSDLVGNFYYKLNEIIELDYNFSFDRDLNFSNYDSLQTKIGSNKFITAFDYISESNDFGSSKIVKNDTKYKFTDEQMVKFNTTKNLKDDFTQFYKLSINMKRLLLASFEYQKNFLEMVI